MSWVLRVVPAANSPLRECYEACGCSISQRRSRTSISKARRLTKSLGRRLARLRTSASYGSGQARLVPARWSATALRNAGAIAISRAAGSACAASREQRRREMRCDASPKADVASGEQQCGCRATLGVVFITPELQCKWGSASRRCFQHALDRALEHTCSRAFP